MSERDRLKEELDRLPREIEPSRDLWPGIWSRIRPHAADSAAAGSTGAPEPTSFRRAWRAWPTELVAAAAAIVVFLAGWGVAKLGSGGGGVIPGPETTPSVAIEHGTPVEEDAAQDYEAAQRALLATLESGSIAPETAALIRRDLAAMDAAVTDFRAALEASPDDPRLQKQLNTEVRRRQHVLRRIAGIQIAGLQLGGKE